MKKLLGILMILILIAGVFVSCSQDKIEEAAVSGEELLNVSFDASSGRARDLVVDTPEFDDGDYVWYYTAKKADSTGFNTGAKSVKTPVKDPDVPIEDRDERKGLSGAVISGLSQGYWDFGLYAYVPVADTEVTPHDYSGDDVAWQGSVSHFLLVKGAANVVDVTVSPSTQGKGYLVVDLEHITVDDDPITAHPGTSLVYTVTRVGGTQSIPIEDNQGNPLPIDAGAYVVKVVCTGSNIDYAEDSIVVNVYSGLTRRVWGSIGELTTSATFGDITGEIIEASTPKIDQDYLNHLTTDSVEFTSDEGTVPVTASLPKTAAQVLLDSVTTPGSSTDLTLTLNVKADTETTSGTTTTKAYNIDLVQKVVTTTESSSTTTVSNFGDVLSAYLTATITIEKNLSDTVKVKHTLAGEAVPMFDLGTADTPTDTQIAADATAGYPGFYKYNSATGELKLMTKKFSPFEVTYTKPVSGIAAVYRGTVSTETLVASCKSLTDAIELAVDGDVVKVLQNTSYGSDAKVSKEISINISDASIVDITTTDKAIALAGRGYEVTFDYEGEGALKKLVQVNYIKTRETDAVARIGDLYFRTLQEAINAALDGETIVVLKSITLDDIVVVPENLEVILDLNGKVLTNNVTSSDSYYYGRYYNTASGRLFVLLNGSSLTVNANGGSMEIPSTNADSYGFFRVFGGTLTLNGGMYSGDTNNGTLFHAYTGSYSELYLNDVTAATNYRIVASNGNVYGTIVVSGGVFTQNNKDLISTGGTIPAFYISYWDATFENVSITSYMGSCVAIRGSYLDLVGASSEWLSRFCAKFRGNNVFTVEHTNTIQGWNDTAISVEANGVAIIKSGTYKAPKVGGQAAYIFTSDGHLTISGGSFEAETALQVDNNYYPQYYSETPSIEVSGGTFSGKLVKGSNTEFAISGGKFDRDPRAYVAEGYGVVYDKTTGLFEVVESWTKGIEPYAEATDLEITTAEELAKFAVSVSAAADKSVWGGKIITLGADINLSGKAWEPIVNFSDDPASYTSGLTFNGNGHTITGMNAVGKHDVGLFSSSCGVHVSNLTMKEATVVGINRVGAIAGHGMCLYCDNCTVENSYLMAYVENNDDGDKVGGIVGYFTCDVAPEQEIKPHVNNCSVKNSTIIGYRDIGCVIGCGDSGKNDITLTGLVSQNNQIVNDRSCNYKNYETDSQFNVGEIMGRNIDEVKFSECVNEGNVILVPNQD